jgi:hypothetical protein
VRVLLEDVRHRQGEVFPDEIERRVAQKMPANTCRAAGGTHGSMRVQLKPGIANRLHVCGGEWPGVLQIQSGQLSRFRGANHLDDRRRRLGRRRRLRIRRRVAHEPQRLQSRKLLPHLDQRIVIEADDRDVALVAAGGDQHALEFGDNFRPDLDLHQQPLAGRDRLDLFLEQRDFLALELGRFPAAGIEGARLRLGQVPDGHVAPAAGALRGLVVKHDDLAVLPEVNVGLDRVGLLLPREPRRSHGVLRGVVRRAAMGDNLNGGEMKRYATDDEKGKGSQKHDGKGRSREGPTDHTEHREVRYRTSSGSFTCAHQRPRARNHLSSLIFTDQDQCRSVTISGSNLPIQLLPCRWCVPRASLRTASKPPS